MAAAAISAVLPEVSSRHTGSLWVTLQGDRVLETARNFDCKSLIANPKVQKHVLDFIEASDKEEYVLALYDRYVVNNPAFPQRDDVSHLLRQAVKDGKKIVLEGPQSFWCARALASLAAARQSLIPSPLPVPSGSRTRARSSGTRERARTPARRACSRRAG